jgi:hypothetical protein|tara:strand:- start:1194 stop:1397 length:204 start_codon:yes stop_codon:yes gene_type:complete
MSSEQLENTNNNLEHDKLIISKNTHRVDINHLMFKIRENESKAKKENLFLFILVFSIILSVGLVLSF